MNKKEYDTALAKLDAWANRRGFEICRGYGIDAYIHEEKHIVYNSKIKSKKNQVYSLLHECGHAIAYNSKGYKESFPTLAAYRFKDSKVNKRRNVYRCEVIAEELDAWKRGLKLAGRLKINLNKEDYNNYASRWVMTYVREQA
tara:strand:+ start:3789 stop:4217 length:429 start_codon:yes stop_codon:yes gene_type:complete